MEVILKQWTDYTVEVRPGRRCSVRYRVGRRRADSPVIIEINDEDGVAISTVQFADGTRLDEQRYELTVTEQVKAGKSQ